MLAVILFTIVTILVTLHVGTDCAKTHTRSLSVPISKNPA